MQTFSGAQHVALLQATKDAAGNSMTEQVLAVGPVASQEAIKQLGTNGGGFFNVNAAHPFENPTPFTNLLQIFSLLLIPVALTLHVRRHGEGRRARAGPCSRRCSRSSSRSSTSA